MEKKNMCINCTSISNKEDTYVALACEQANKSNALYKHGCIAILNGKIIARGFNHARTRCRYNIIDNPCSCHAEMDVLKKCLKILSLKQLKKVTLCVVRMSTGGHVVSSVPCYFCTKQIKKYNIKKIIYSDENGDLKRNKISDFESNYITYANNKFIITQ